MANERELDLARIVYKVWSGMLKCGFVTAKIATFLPKRCAFLGCIPAPICRLLETKEIVLFFTPLSPAELTQLWEGSLILVLVPHFQPYC